MADTTQTHPGTPDPDVDADVREPAGSGAGVGPGALPLFSAETAAKIVSRLGLAFLLVGLAFLFRWSIVQGWIGPTARVAIGGLVSAGLLGVGHHLRLRLPIFGALLQGGGLAGLFLSTFAAHHLYDLIGEAGAFASLLVVSALAVALSVQQSSQGLAIVGFVGAVSVPTAVAGFDAFVAAQTYMAVVALAAGGLYAAKRWLIPWSLVGLALAAHVAAAIVYRGSTEIARSVGCGFLECGPPRLGDLATDTQVAITAGVVAFWLVPVLVTWRDRSTSDPIAVIGAAIVPITAFQASYLVWQHAGTGPSNLVWATVGLTGAATVAWMAGRFAARDLHGVAAAHSIAAVGLGALAVLLGFDGTVELLGLALVGAGLVLTAERIPVALLDPLGQFIVVVAGLRTIARTELSAAGAAPGADAWALLGVVGVYAAIAEFYGRSTNWERRPLGLLYGLGAHVGMLYWVTVQFGRLDEQSAAVTIGWAAYALVMIAAAAVTDRSGVRTAGLATLGLAVAKLTIVDFASASTGWKIAMFMGFGTVMLGVGYWLVDRDEKRPDANVADPNRPDPNQPDPNRSGPSGPHPAGSTASDQGGGPPESGPAHLCSTGVGPAASREDLRSPQHGQRGRADIDSTAREGADFPGAARGSGTSATG